MVVQSGELFESRVEVLELLEDVFAQLLHHFKCLMLDLFVGSLDQVT